MKISIVTTMYYSEKYLEEFFRRIKSEVKKYTDDYEIIFVNDGSPDGSLEKAIHFQKEDENVLVIDLSRNFGHHKAIMTGLSYSKGDRVFLIDCDLEEEPELLSLFYEKLDAEPDADVVYGVQIKRKGNFFERFSGEVFYTLMSFLSNINLPRNFVTARLMSRRYVTSLLEFKERELFLGGIWQITGYKQIPVQVVKLAKGETTYTLRKKFSLLINSITSFSNKPLLYIFYTGILISFFSSIYIIYLIIRKLFWGIAIEGWATVVVSVWILGGINIFFMGIIGIYLSKIFIEVKNRPYTIIRQIHKAKKDIQ